MFLICSFLEYSVPFIFQPSFIPLSDFYANDGRHFVYVLFYTYSCEGTSTYNIQISLISIIEIQNETIKLITH